MGTHTEFHFVSSGADVRIAGCWTGWTSEPMTRGDGDRWTYSAPLAPGTDVQFKFVVDGEWMSAEHYDQTDDGHGAKNNSRCVDHACEHPAAVAAENPAQPGADAIEGEAEQTAVVEPAPAVTQALDMHDAPGTEQEKAEDSAEGNAQGKVDGDADGAAPQTPNDGVSDVSQEAQQRPAALPAKLVSMSESTSVSSGTSKSCSPDDSKERAVEDLTSAGKPGKLEKLLSDCVSDTDDAKAQVEVQEDFEIEDSDTEENAEENAEEKVDEKISLEQLKDIPNLKANGSNPEKKEEDGCVMV